MQKPDHDLYLKACEAYQKHCEETGVVHREPTEALTTMGWKWVYLRNNYGELAKYNRWTGQTVDYTGD
jgi:hypothetical protein